MAGAGRRFAAPIYRRGLELVELYLFSRSVLHGMSQWATHL